MSTQAFKVIAPLLFLVPSIHVAEAADVCLESTSKDVSSRALPSSATEIYVHQLFN